MAWSRVIDSTPAAPAAAALVLRHAPTRGQRFENLSALQDQPSTRSLLRSLQLAPPDRPQTWNAYDVLYVAGGVNTGPKPTVLPLSITKTDASHARPRRLLLSNVLNARADSILAPTAEQVLLAASRSAVTIDALFGHTALQTWGRALVDPPDDTNAPILTAALPIALSFALGPIPNENTLPAPDSTAYHATALTNLIHTVRLDTTTIRGRAALLAFNYLREADAIHYHDGHLYTAAPDTVTTASAKLAHDLVDRRGGGAALSFVERYDTVPPFLHSLLAQLDDAGIPRALAFEQGKSVLRGLDSATAARSGRLSTH